MNQPDILFIVLDTQRADRLGCYGYDRAITPHLDRFAAEGALFEEGIAPAQWTVPSHAAMFTGLYPTAHQVTQSNHSLGARTPHLVLQLQRAGYETIGFCNNPLVGILNNGFKRGFDTFYNYGGAIPSVPDHSSSLPWPLNEAAESYTQFLRRISYPIQNFFGQSDLAFRISLTSWLTPLWSRLANFKGQNERSARDIAHFLDERERRRGPRPLFMFVNLMETHLPFWPPADHIDRVAPYLRRSKEARAVMRRWNREAYRWAAPLAEPLPDFERQVLSDLYDAEVAYQDAYLRQVFDTLARRRNRRNTLTIIVADHGDGLGEHDYFGHAFVAYQELVHVPLIVHWPAEVAPARVAGPVSTRRVYHTMLAAAGIQPRAVAGMPPVDVGALSLKATIDGRDPEGLTAYAEVFPPLNFVRAIERRQPRLIEEFECLAVRRAVVREGHKLIHVDDAPRELYDLAADPAETTNQVAAAPGVAAALDRRLRTQHQHLLWQQSYLENGSEVEVGGDQALRRQLRSLGYLD